MTQVFTPFDWFDADEYNGGTGPLNFGISVFQSNTPVKEIIFDRLPATRLPRRRRGRSSG